MTSAPWRAAAIAADMPALPPPTTSTSHSAMTGFDDEAWGRLIAGADVPIEDQLAAFSATRRELVYVLRGLSDEQWARTGQHELRGTVTIEAVAQSIVEHEAEHRAQLEACM